MQSRNEPKHLQPESSEVAMELDFFALEGVLEDLEVFFFFALDKEEGMAGLYESFRYKK